MFAQIRSNFDRIVNSANIVLASLLMIGLYQNCSDVGFASKPFSASSLDAADYTVKEDEVLNDSLIKDLSAFYGGKETTLEITSTTMNGSITNFDPASGAFTYTPVQDYFGVDEFSYRETYVYVDGEGNPQSEVVERRAIINILAQNDEPKILTEEINVEMNTENDVVIEATDVDGGALVPMISANNDSMVGIEGVVLRSDGNGNIRLTSSGNYRGTQSHTFYVKDAEGALVSKEIKIIVGNPLYDLEPAMAVRASGCVSCHANVDANYISDFGLGSGKFFGGIGQNINTAFSTYYGDHTFSWVTARFNKDILVPKDASFSKDLSTVDKLYNWWGTRLSKYVEFNQFKKDIQPVRSLADYIRLMESYKSQPATVKEKDSIYIGAPSIAKMTSMLNGREKIFYKDSSASPSLSGLSPQYTINGTTKKYFKADGDLVCDGDLILNGGLILRSVKIKTINGCRIYVNGPVFTSGKITYEDLDGGLNLTNLQITSSRMIAMGVGLKHCEVESGWYRKNAPNDSPLRKRLQDHMAHAFLRNYAERDKKDYARANDDLLEFAQGLTKQDASAIVDASCDSDGGRSNSYERLLLNAPLIHSRYQGSYRGVIIAEVPLFSLSRFSFQFDPVFKRAPVLPLLDLKDFLEVK
tara:strand:+ start:694 stop:2619 length:1926 start_codon:yes stop_codon:yes gene_type:complete